VEEFGRYILIRRIAEGGMGELYLARQSGPAGFAKQLVVKRIKPALAGDRAFVDMFLEEGRIAALIDHPNVVHIHELGQSDGQYFIAMEYVPGLSLARVLELQGGPLELSTTLYIARDLCEGLAHAHGARSLDGQPLGLVHRDVSPPNILLGYTGCVKILDFGIAKIRRHGETGAGVLKGRFAYLSPEQARGEPIDARSDIYALGLVLYEMTVGGRANPGASDTEMVVAASKGELHDPLDHVPDYPEPLRQIFLRATARAPDERYPQVKDLQEDLLALQVDQRLGVSAGSVGEWVRALAGPEAAEDGGAGEAATPRRDPESPVSASPVTARIAYEPTVHALRPAEGLTPAGEADGERERGAEGTPTFRPMVLEVDLEKEREPLRGEAAPGPAELRALRGAGPARSIMVAVAVLGVLGLLLGGLLWSRSRDAGPPAPGSEPPTGTSTRPGQGRPGPAGPGGNAQRQDAGAAEHHGRQPSGPDTSASLTQVPGHGRVDASLAARMRAAMLKDSRPAAPVRDGGSHPTVTVESVGPQPRPQAVHDGGPPQKAEAGR